MSDLPPDDVPLFAFDPSDPADPRRGTVLGPLALGFGGGDDPVLDAGSFALARARWRMKDLTRVPLEALALSARLSPIDRRAVGRAWYERTRLALVALEHRAIGEDLALLAERLGALVRGAMYADPVAERAARETADELVAGLRSFRYVWERHAGEGDRVRPWPDVRRLGRWA